MDYSMLTLISTIAGTCVSLAALLTLFGKSQKHSQQVDDRLSSIEEKVGIAYEKSLKNETDIARMEASMPPLRSYRSRGGGGGKE